MGGAWGGPLTEWVGGEGDRFVMTFSDVFLPVPFLASLLTFTEFWGLFLCPNTGKAEHKDFRGVGAEGLLK